MKTYKRRKRKTRKCKTCKRKHKTHKGGNYEKDVTSKTLEGVAVKPFNKFVIVSDGMVLSASAYMKHMENMDRNGYRYG